MFQTWWNYTQTQEAQWNPGIRTTKAHHKKCLILMMNRKIKSIQKKIYYEQRNKDKDGIGFLMGNNAGNKAVAQ